MTSIETPISAGAEVVCAGLVHVYTSEQGPIAALRNADLVVKAGEMLAIVGPSGSGKTTLMLLLSGLLQPTAGSVLIDGQDITQLDAPSLSRLRATQALAAAPGPAAQPAALCHDHPEHQLRLARRPSARLAAALVDRRNRGADGSG